MWIYAVLLIVLCNMASFRASKVLISLLAIELGASQFVIGLLVALYSLFPMLLALYAGKLSDRLGVRWPMIAGSLGLAFGLTLPYFTASLIGLFASAALIGASHVFYNVSVQNLVGKLGAPEDRTRPSEEWWTCAREARRPPSPATWTCGRFSRRPARAPPWEARARAPAHGA